MGTTTYATDDRAHQQNSTDNKQSYTYIHFLLLAKRFNDMNNAKKGKAIKHIFENNP